MHYSRILLLAILIGGLVPQPTVAVGAPALIITINLSKSSITIQKNTSRSRAVLTDWIVPVAPGSIRPGIYSFERMKEEYRSRNGNVTLRDVLRTSGGFNLRTSRRFEAWRESGRPASHTIVLRAETGSMLFTLIDTHKMEKAVLRVLR